MNGRKREEKREEREDESKGKSERSELRPPDTSTLPLPLNTHSTPTLNPTQIPTIYSTQNTILSTIRPTFLSTLIQISLYIIYTTHNITTNRLDFLDCSSFSTDSRFDAEHIIPFASTLGRSPFRNDNNSGTCVSSVTFNIVIVVYRLDVVNTI